MILTAILSALTILAMVISIFRFPVVRFRRFRIGGYCFFAVIGALLLLALGCVSPREAASGIFADSDVNPIKILILFLSMTAFSVFLDELGLFRYLASLALRRAGTSQTALFLLLYATVSILTVFTSNDIIILTFTPFVCAFARNAHINPLPYLFAEFFAANTWSMALMIGNPTNIYIASFLQIDFFTYLRVMAVPTLGCGLISLLLLYLIFRRSLGEPIEAEPETVSLQERTLLIVGVVHLLLCIVMLAISSYIGIPMWLISLVLLVSLFTIVCVYRTTRRERPVILLATLRRMPWELVPFMLAMFVLVIALERNGICAALVTLLDTYLGGSVMPTVTYGASSFLCANLINNIPMSVLFANLSLQNGTRFAAFASIVGSNLGAYLTPVGALAGIMWADILRRERVQFDYRDFIRYGAMVSIPTLFVALLLLPLFA